MAPFFFAKCMFLKEIFNFVKKLQKTFQKHVAFRFETIIMAIVVNEQGNANDSA
jgi:hypothetical protein